MTDTSTGPRVRPRDRKAQIVDAAILLFHRDGFHRVSIGQIAAAVGITGGAVYRHFASKQDLLAAALFTVIDEYRAVAESAGPGLDEIVRALVDHVLSDRARGPLWQQHARDVPLDQQRALRVLIRGIAARLGDRIRIERPDLDAADVDLLSWAVLAVMDSPYEHRAASVDPSTADVIVAAALAVCASGAVPAAPGPSRRTQSPHVGLAPVSRREAILVAAATQFSERGYDAVTLESIAVEAGVTAPNVYNHFEGKADLLMAVLDRGRELLQAGLIQALEDADSPDAAIEPVVRSYVRAAMRPGHLPGLLFREGHRVPDDDQRVGRRQQREYVDEWANLLPVPLPEGRVRAHAAISLINNLTQTQHLRDRSSIATELATLAVDVLRAPAPRD